jgi:hypothetical protein
MTRFQFAFVGATVAFAAYSPPLGAQPKPLDQRADLAKPVDIPLRDFLDYISEKYRVTVRLDEAGFKKAGIDKARERHVRLPKLPEVPLALLLEAAASQIGGTVRQSRGEITIAPGKREFTSILGPASDDLKKKLAAKIDISKPVENAPLHELIHFFSDQGGATIVVAEWLFPATKPSNAGNPADNVAGGMWRFSDVRYNLPAESRSLEKWLDFLATQIKGTVVARENVILIVPATKSRP